MSNDLHRYTEELTRVYIETGLPHSLAKVLVYLTICNPPRQTAGDIQQQLAISVGSVNTALNVLLRAGLIIRNKTAGDRRYFYELDSDAWRRSILQRLSALDILVKMARRGTELMPGNPRLIAMQDMYEYFGNEFKGIVARFEQREKN